MTTIAELGISLSVSGNAAAGLDAATASVNKYVAAAEKAAGVTDQTSAAITRSGKSAQGFAAQNDGVTIATNRAAAAFTAVTKAQEAFALAASRGNAAIAAQATTISNLQTKAASAQGTLDAVNKAAAAGASPFELLAIAQGKVVQGHGALGASSKAVSGSLRDVGIQAVDMASQLAAGAPIFTTMQQQLSQIGQQAAASGVGLKQLAGAVGGAVASAFRFVVSPIGLAITGLVAFGGAAIAAVAHSITLSSEMRELNTAISAVGRSADVSASAVQKMVSASLATGLSREEADTIAGAAIRNPRISQGQIGQILGQATNLATATGQSPADAMKDYMAAVAGSAAAVLKLDTQLNFLSAAQRQAVHDNGDLSSAIDLLNARINHLHDDSLTGLGKLWIALKFDADAALTGITRGIDAVAAAGKRATGGQAFDVPGVETNADALTGGLDGGVTKEFADAQAKANPLLDAANKKVQDLTQAYRDQQTVLRAGITQRSVVQAGISAENATRDQELSVDDKLIVKQAAMAAASAQAADAGVQETAAQQRAIASGLLIAGTYDQTRASTLTATAATVAHEKAVTTAGIAEVGYAQALLNRGAAEAAAAGAGTIQDLQEQLDATNRLNAAEQLGNRAAHYTALSIAVDQATKELEAQRDVATDPRIIDALTQQIAAIRQVKFARDDADSTQANLAANNALEDQLKILKLQGSLIGQNAAETAKQVAEMQTLLQLEKDEGADPARLTESQQKRIALNGALAQGNELLQEQKAAMQELAGLFTSAFDQISQGITNSLLQGTGAAVNWGNIMKSVAQQVLSAFLKLAILNPLLNGLLGQNLATLGSVGGLLGGIGGAAGGVGGTGGGGGLLSLIGLGSQGAQASGLTGSNGILGSVFGEGSQIQGILSTPLFGGGAAAGATNSALGGLGEGVFGPATAGQFSAAGGVAPTTLGGFAGGVGLGFTGGSCAGALIQTKLRRTAA